ncbi:MAG: hypothetical protein DRN57_08620 [Thermoplasmata archaeon]|nr:MAG: hypothetical protein DRN57_08620 [Thermoplasmata archaeon]
MLGIMRCNHLITGRAFKNTLKCKYCGSEHVIRHGRRTTVRGHVQIYLCRSCSRTFSTSPVPYLNTDPAILLKGISLYNQGFSLKEVSDMLEKIFGRKVPRNTIHYWTVRYRDLFPYVDTRKGSPDRLPLIARSYGDRTFSLHRTKVLALHERFRTVTLHLFSVYRKFEPRIVDMNLIRYMGRNKLPRDGEFIEDTVESRILGMASLYSESDPLREVLINDIHSICRNLPIFYNDSEGREYHRFIDLVQVRDDRIGLLNLGKGDLSLLEENALAFSSLTGIPPDRISMGYLNEKGLYLMTITPVREKGKNPPKNN